MSDETTLVLKEALALIPDARHWAQHKMVRHIPGEAVEKAYCASGALCYAAEHRARARPVGSGDGYYTQAVHRLKRAAGLGEFQSIPSWNDASHRSYFTIRAAFEKAIRDGAA